MSIKVWQVPTDAKILPSTEPPQGESGYTSIRMFRGETRAVSFCLRSDEQLRLTIEGEHVVFHDSLPKHNIKYVKCWFQAKESVAPKTLELRPELLTKDQMFVQLGPNQTNNCKDSDADILQPMLLPKGYTQQIWVDIAVPEDCRGGAYVVDFNVKNNDGSVHEVFCCRVQVMPFTLPKSPMLYGVYYRGVLHDGPAEISDTKKTERQYRADLRCMRRHGIEHPTLYEAGSDWIAGARAVELRMKEDFSCNPLFWTRLGAGRPSTELGEWKQNAWALAARMVAPGRVLAYGKDEARGAELSEQIQTWGKLSQYGVEVMIAGHGLDDLYKGSHGIPSVVACNDDPATINPETIQKFHMLRRGMNIWTYGPTSWDDPVRYRKRYGLDAYRLGLDGCCPYAWQHIYGSVAGDVGGKYKNHLFALPTLDGCVETLALKGYRDAQMDVRTAALLESLGGKVPNGDDCNAVREAMVDKIIQRSFFEGV